MRRLRAVPAAALMLFAAACFEKPPQRASEDLGARVFSDNCPVCHSLPILSSLFEQNRGRPPGFVLDALEIGNMRRVGAALDDRSRRAVAEFFTGVDFDAPEAVRDFAIPPPCDAERRGFDWQEEAHPSWGRSNRNDRALPDERGFSRAEVERLAGR